MTKKKRQTSLKSYAGNFSVFPESIVISLNPENPDIGTFVSRVYNHKERDSSVVLWDSKYAKNILTSQEIKTLEKLVKKLMRKSNLSKNVKITYTKRDGFHHTNLY